MTGLALSSQQKLHLPTENKDDIFQHGTEHKILCFFWPTNYTKSWQHRYFGQKQLKCYYINSKCKEGENTNIKWCAEPHTHWEHRSPVASW